MRMDNIDITEDRTLDLYFLKRLVKTPVKTISSTKHYISTYNFDTHDTRNTNCGDKI